MELTVENLIKLREQVLKLERPGEIEKLFNSKTLYQRFKETALRKLDAPAILYFGNIITYRQMLGLIDTAAKGFQEIGIKYNDMVTMSLLSTPYGIVSFYALDKIGATMHMVNGSASIDEMLRELSDANSEYFVANDIFCGVDTRTALRNHGVRKIVTTSLLDGIPMGFNGDRLKYQFIEKLKGIRKKEFNGSDLIDFDTLLNMGRASVKDLVACEYVPNKIATISYTSGSTGESKAAVATWDGLDALVQVMGMTEIGRFSQNDVMFSTFPLWINFSLLNMIHEPLVLGVALGLDPLFNPKNLSKRNEQYKFNHWLTIPAYIKSFVNSQEAINCSRWKIVLTGGGPLDTTLKIKADQKIKKNGGNVQVGQGYGATETLGSVAYTYYENATLGSVGKPCIGNQIKILDVENHSAMQANQTGVAYLYTPARSIGYFGNVEATDKSFVRDEEGVVWYNTEDLAHVNENGEIFIDGRLRRIAITFDEKGNPTKIIPERVSKSISQLPDVDICEVITVPDETLENVSVAFVVPKNYELYDSLCERVKAHCEKNVPKYMVPKEVFILDEMPLTSSKKPNVPELEKMYQEFSLDSKDVKKHKKKKIIRKLFNR